MTSSNVYLLKQGMSLLRQIDDRLYQRVPVGVAKAGIGGHMRHCLDFYGSFLRGVGAGKIDYDHRERNELIEKDRATAIEMIEATITRLRSLALADAGQVVLVKLEGEDAQDLFAWTRSSVSREVQFLLSHTVHHYALIAMLLRWQGFEPAADFGIAPSTLKYWQAKA
jgi:uncharacterized damage-inducible protein DinB